MRILYLAPRECWPPITGAKLRDFHLASQLSARAQVLYLGYTENGSRRDLLWRGENFGLSLVQRPPRYTPLQLIRGFVGPKPVSVLNYRSAPMDEELTRILREKAFDSVQIEGVHLSGYLDRIVELAPGVPIVCDWHNVESELMRRYAAKQPGALKRLYAERTAALLDSCEAELLRRCAAHTVCSPREQQLLLSRSPSARVEVVPNGVDTEFFAAAAEKRGERRHVLFVGSMDYHANIDAAVFFSREVWPRLRGMRPDLQFVIVGSRPAPEVLALGAQEGVTVTGTVDDIRPYYEEALTVVVPLRVGAGTRLKALEAMAAGVPVVSTTLGVEGLRITAGEDVLIADSPEDLASTIAALDAGSGRWADIADRARRLVADRYDWKISGAELWRIHLECMRLYSGPPIL